MKSLKQRCKFLFLFCMICFHQQTVFPQDKSLSPHEICVGKVVSFAEESPLSSISQLKARLNPKGMQRDIQINIDPRKDTKSKDETFLVCVPSHYKQEKSIGLIVWISPNNNPGNSMLVPEYQSGYSLKFLEKYNLIYISAFNSGNNRKPWIRFSLALDAVHNLKKNYNIDEKRVYISGFSGGGRSTSLLGLVYPDVFTGAFSIGGCVYFREIPNPNKIKTFWPPIVPVPNSSFMKKMKKENRFALLAGLNDYNLEETKSIYGKYLEDGFEHVGLFEIPNLGHDCPNTEWAEKVLNFLDMPVLENRKLLLNKLTECLKNKEKDLLGTYRSLLEIKEDDPFSEAAIKSSEEIEKILADPKSKNVLVEVETEKDRKRMLRMVESSLNNSNKKLAMKYMKLLIDNYPNSIETKEAQLLYDRKY